MASSSSSDPKVNTTALQSLASTYPKNKPVTMLNLIRFRPTAVYTTETNLPVCTGSEAYRKRYLPAVRPILTEIGAEIISVGKAWDGLIEGSEEWDLVVIVRYPGIDTFVGLAGSERYQKEAGVHRTAAVGGYALFPMEIEG